MGRGVSLVPIVHALPLPHLPHRVPVLREFSVSELKLQLAMANDRPVWHLPELLVDHGVASRATALVVVRPLYGGPPWCPTFICEQKLREWIRP